MTTDEPNARANRPRGGLLAACLLLVIAAGAGAARAATEVWVVDEISRDIAILDADTEAVIGGVSLTDMPASPYGIAFSSVPGHVGQFAFVTQGSLIRVVDTAMRTVVRTVDIAAALGHPATLRGCDSARPRDFTDISGTVIKSYLHVAAQVQPGPTGPTEPWFLVLDQQALAVDPPGTPPLVAAASLNPPAGSVTGEAMDVVVLPTEHGSAFQRAWYTVRADSGPPRIFILLAATSQPIGSPWSVTRVRETPFSPGTLLPDSVDVAAPFSREFPLAPLGPSGLVVNLDTGGPCTPGGVVRSVAVTGAGPGDYNVFVADAPSGTPGTVRRIDPQTCAQVTYPVGVQPVDIAVVDPLRFRKAFVANHGSGNVTALRPDGSFGTIVVGSGPRSVRPNIFVIGCTVKDLTADRVGTDVSLAWTSIACDTTKVAFQVWCYCHDHCPPECVLTTAANQVTGALGEDPLEIPAGAFAAGGKWGPLGVTTDTHYIHAGGGGLAFAVDAPDATLGSITYSVEPCTIGDVFCMP